MESPAIQALRQQNADALLEAIKDRVQPGMAPDALEFTQWLASRMYEDARRLAYAARKEQEQKAVQP
jgi:hypothetical protein